MAGLLARVPPAVPLPERSERGSSALASGVAAIGLLLVGAIALGWAATITAADLAAEQGLAGRAVTLNPLRKDYLAQKAQALERTASRSDDEAATLRQAIEIYETLLRRFKPDNDDVLALAIARFELAQVEDAPLDRAIEDFERAVALDPYNYLLKSFVADFYERQGLDDLALEHRLEIYFWFRPMESGGP
jgi:tetratricopeptide (TPR) repeat protein